MDPLGLRCEGTATVHHYPATEDNPFGHYSIHVKTAYSALHTHQVFSNGGKSTYIIDDVSFLEKPIKSIQLKLPDAKSAISYQKLMFGKNFGPYDKKTNSCVTHVAEVLRSGGVDVPKSPIRQYGFLKSIGF